jgi:hypothetical protein
VDSKHENNIDDRMKTIQPTDLTGFGHASATRANAAQRSMAMLLTVRRSGRRSEQRAADVRLNATPTSNIRTAGTSSVGFDRRELAARSDVGGDRTGRRPVPRREARLSPVPDQHTLITSICSPSERRAAPGKRFEPLSNS